MSYNNGKNNASGGSGLSLQTEVPGGMASSNNYASVSESINEMQNLIEKKQIKEETIERVFPGYLDEKFQSIIERTEIYSNTALSGWDSQDFIQFDIDPSDSQRYIPSNIRLLMYAKLRSTAGTNVPPNVIPVENFFKKYFKKIELRNKLSNELINKDIEYSSDIQEFLQHFKYDKEDYKHSIEDRNQSLCEVLGRRLGKNKSYKRLSERINSPEKNKWDTITKFEIPLSILHPFFKISEKMWMSINVKLFMETDWKKLFEAVPTADVTDQTIELAKVEKNKSKAPELIYPIYTVSPEYRQNEMELFKENQTYDYGNYVKIHKRPTTIIKGADSSIIDVLGINERPNYMIIQIQSLTADQHASHYDNTFEDAAQKLLKRVIVTGCYNETGMKIINYELDNDNRPGDKYELYGSLRRLTNGTPVYALNTNLIDTKYMKNFITEDEFNKGFDDKNVSGCYPLVIDLSDSKGSYYDSDDNIDIKSPKMQVSLYFKKQTTEQYNIIITVLTKSKIVLERNENGLAVITKY